MSISSLPINNTSDSLQRTETTNETRLRPSISGMTRRVNSVAVPIVAVAALSNIPGAGALDCMSICDPLPSVWAQVLCYIACFIQDGASSNVISNVISYLL